MTSLYLYHHSIKGQRWGIRRFQNKDGSLTSLGRQHAKTLEKDGIDKISSKDNLRISKGSSFFDAVDNRTEYSAY